MMTAATSSTIKQTESSRIWPESILGLGGGRGREARPLCGRWRTRFRSNLSLKKIPSLLLLLLLFLLAEFPPSFVFPSLLGTSIKRLFHLLERPLAFRRKSKPRFLELKFSLRHLFYYHYGNFLNVDRPPKPPRPSLIFAATGTDKKEQLSMTQKNWSSEGGGDGNVAPTPKKGGEGAPASCKGHFSSSSTFRSPTSF